MHRILIFLLVLLLTAPAAVLAMEDEWDTAYYAVQAGDCLDMIAEAYCIPKAVVMQMNLLRDEKVVPGQILRFQIPGRSDAEFGGLFVSPNLSVPYYTAVHFFVTENTLEDINVFPEKGTVLQGQILKIPIRNSVFLWTDVSVLLEDAYIVQEGDTTAAIAEKFAVDEQRLIAINRLQERKLYPGYILHLGRMECKAKEGYRNGYVVQKGDTLSRIAGRYLLSIDEIVAVNDFMDADQLVKGQILLLP